MRIDIHLITAVLPLAAFWITCSSQATDLSFVGNKPNRRSNNRRESRIFAWSTGGEGLGDRMDQSWLTHRDQVAVLREKGREEVDPLECCPSRLEMVEPEGGKNQDGMLVTLYRDGENIQRFYDLSCREEVVNKPCRFVERKLYNQSRCVQKYSYSYALVATEENEHRHHHPHPHHGQKPLANRGWKMDYIEVRSGCSCEIMPKIKKKKNALRSKKNHRSKKVRLEADAT